MSCVQKNLGVEINESSTNKQYHLFNKFWWKNTFYSRTDCPCLHTFHIAQGDDPFYLFMLSHPSPLISLSTCPLHLSPCPSHPSPCPISVPCPPLYLSAPIYNTHSPSDSLRIFCRDFIRHQSVWIWLFVCVDVIGSASQARTHMSSKKPKRCIGQSWPSCEVKHLAV